ncbi:MAG: hypothetical protein ACRCT8_12665 [Lacipirellulaceae bacterium]
MVKVVIDEATRAKLFVAHTEIELVNEAGKPLGRLAPTLEGMLEGWEPVTPALSDEELDRRAADTSGPTMTTEELLAYLKRPR